MWKWVTDVFLWLFTWLYDLVNELLDYLYNLVGTILLELFAIIVGTLDSLFPDGGFAKYLHSAFSGRGSLEWLYYIESWFPLSFVLRLVMAYYVIWLILGIYRTIKSFIPFIGK